MISIYLGGSLFIKKVGQNLTKTTILYPSSKRDKALLYNIDEMSCL